MSLLAFLTEPDKSLPPIPGSFVDSSPKPPTLTDATVMSMRPTGRILRTYVIAADGTGDFTTFGAALIAGAKVQQAYRIAENRSELTPNHWIRYLVKPGTAYDNSGGWNGSIGPFSAFYALDSTRGTTRLNWGIEPTGGFYWEGIDVTNVDNNGAFDPKYAMHLHANATIIIARSALTNNAPQAGGYPMPIGMDGVTGATLVCHDVDFTTGPRLSNHGLIGGTGPLAGMTIVYSKCRYSSGSLYFDTLNDSDLSEMWVIGSIADTYGLVGDKSVLHLDPVNVFNRTTGSFSGHVKKDLTPATGVTDSRTDWPVPTGGLSVRDRIYYGM